MRRSPPLIRELPPAGDAVGRMLALHAAEPERHPVLLESAASGGPLGRFSLLLSAPGDLLRLDREGRVVGPAAGTRFCDSLDAWWRRERGEPPPDPWPFGGGWFLFLGYELAGEVEPTLRLPPAPRPLVACAWRMRAAVLHDHTSGRSLIVAESGAEPEGERLAASFAGAQPQAFPRVAGVPDAVVEDDPETYLALCRRALTHIAAGDVYQANLARAWRGRLDASVEPATLYARLRRANPGAFSGIAALPGLAILSSSPERLVRVRGRDIDTRPIAGTRPRLPAGDAIAIAELTGSAKERAEHVMLIDQLPPCVIVEHGH